MVCGGSAEVLIAYVPSGDAALREVLAAVQAARAARRRAWLFTLLPADDADGGRRVETACWTRPAC